MLSARPADALQVNRHRRPDGSGLRRDADDARLDGEERASERLAAIAERQPVQAAEILRDRHRLVDAAIAIDRELADHSLLRREAIAAHATADVGLPHELQRGSTGNPSPRSIVFVPTAPASA